MSRPQDWRAFVKKEISANELKALERCVKRGCPYGSTDWIEQTVVDLGLGSTLRMRGHPRKIR